jgi:glycosyltransferase involved in cell wall biosynthesis
MLPETESAKVRQIYNGLDIRTFVANGLRVKASEPVRILSVARLIEPKGLVYLLEACDRLRARGYRFRCVIIGGPERPLYVNDYLEIRRTHERLALDGCVDLLGALPFAAVRAQYARADLFALPCVRGRDGSKDIIPNAILEAMAAGLPVVATRLTAIPELVDDGVTGLLVEPRDIDALAGAMARLIDDAALRAEMGRNGRTRAERLFDIEHNVRSYVEMFEQP